MVRVVRSCIQSILKQVSSFIGIVGMAMILYLIWLIRFWQREIGDLPFEDSDYAVPWFIYTFLGLAITLCVFTCSGHVAAETANGCCLYFHMAFILLLLMLEATVTTDVFLNRDWEEDFPVDPSGSFNKFKYFIRDYVSSWATLLKALWQHQYYESDDDIDSVRVPLLKNAVHPT